MLAGLVLAAGEGRRFGGPKAPHVVDGERLVDRAVRVLREGGCDVVIVVLGAWVGDVPGADVVINEKWQTGMGRSLQVGLKAVTTYNADRVVVSLVDLTGLTGEAVQRVAAAPGDIVVATYAGERGHPVLLGRRYWQDVARSAEGDRGARDFLAAHAAEINAVEVGDIADGADLDHRPVN